MVLQNKYTYPFWNFTSDILYIGIKKVSIYMRSLICDFMLKKGLFLSQSLGLFISNKFEFSEYLRKNWIESMKNQPKVWNILKIHWKYIWLEVSVRDAFEDVQ